MTGRAGILLSVGADYLDNSFNGQQGGTHLKSGTSTEGHT